VFTFKQLLVPQAAQRVYHRLVHRYIQRLQHLCHSVGDDG